MKTVRSLTFLTNALGETTGNGTCSILDSDLDKIPFENGADIEAPFGVDSLPYLVELGRRKWVCNILEIAYRDEWWGEDAGDFPAESEVLAWVQTCFQRLKAKVHPTARVLVPHADMPARWVIAVLIPLSALPGDPEAVREAFAEVFRG